MLDRDERISVSEDMVEVDPPTSAAPPAAQQPVEKAPRKWLKPLVMVSVPLALAVAGGYYWLSGGRYVSTDNAYVQQDKVAVTSEVGGPIIDVRVRENMAVKAGDVLFRIDPQPYELAVRQADADIAGAEVSVATLASEARSTGVGIAAAQDAIDYARIDLERQQALMARGFTTKARLDEAERRVQMAREQLRAAQADAADAARNSPLAARSPASIPRSRRRACAAKQPRSISREPWSARRSAAAWSRPIGCRRARRWSSACPH